MKNVVIIGGGPGGYACALYSARLGMRVSLIEAGALGGTCLNRGCIPTKALLACAGKFEEAVNGFNAYGVSLGPVELDFGKVAARRDKTVKQLSSGVGRLLKKAGVEVIEGVGRVDRPGLVIAATNGSEQEIAADAIVIATGSREVELSGLPFDGETIISSNEMLACSELPDSLIIVGGGVIGVECATIMAKYGKGVTIVELTDQLLPNQDPQLAGLLEGALRDMGVNVYTRCKVERVLQKGTNTITVAVSGADNLELSAAKLLVSVGRRANTEALGLAEAGVSINGGAIATDSTMRTSIDGIYAVGDVTSSPALAHVAYHEARVCALSIAGHSAAMDYSAIPMCVYTSPELAHVGQTEQQALQNGTDVVTRVESFAGNGKAMIEGVNDGYVKLVCEKDTGTLLGCSIIGPKATELIHSMTLPIAKGLPVDELARMVFPHPTLSETLGEALQGAAGLALHGV